MFDHTSVLQFLETFLTQKTGKKIEETNISAWRRTVCGDLTSAFQPYHGEKITIPPFPSRDAFIEGIHQAKFKKLPSVYKGLSKEEIEQSKSAPATLPTIPRQESGVRRSCALPYQLYAEGALDTEKSRFLLHLEARKELFGKNAAGAPFNVFAFGGAEQVQTRAYAVMAGDTLRDAWEISSFNEEKYHLQVHGPNGFMREFQGTADDPGLEIQVEYARAKRKTLALSGQVEVQIVNRDSRSHTLEIQDNAYKSGSQKCVVPPGGKKILLLDTRRNFGWYDFSVRVMGSELFEKRYAGRVETGQWSYSDPAMGHPNSGR